jgi:GcrA cell cycle regulator
MTANGTTLWSSDDRDMVATLLSRGATAAAVGRVMQISRNAAIGRINRDELLLKIWEEMRPKRLPADGRRSSAGLARLGGPDLTVSEAVGRMPLYETGSMWCKWPVNRAPEVVGGVLCCGVATIPGDVYCARHRALSHGGDDG